MKKNDLSKWKIYFEKNKVQKLLMILLISAVQILYFYVIIRKGLPKLTIILFVPLVLIFNFHLYDWLKSKIPFFITNKAKKLYFFFIAALTLIFYKSINLETVFINEGMMTVPFILGALSINFQFVLTASVLLEKSDLEERRGAKKRFNPLYAFPALIVFIFLYFVYFPGLGSPDSIFIWTRVGQNIYSDAHPIIYMFLIKGLRLIWDDIAVVALFQIILSVLVYAFIISEMRKMGVPWWLCWAAAIIIPIIPANALYAITFWKDVPYSLGLLVLSILLLKCLTGDYYQTKKALPQMFFVSLFTLFMRHNALISVFLPLFVLGIYYIVKKDKKLIVKTVILGVCLVVAYFGIKAAVFASLDSGTSEAQYTGKSFVKLRLPATISTQQIIYTQNAAGTSFTEDEKQLFRKFFNAEEIAEHKEKYDNGIWQFYHKPTETTYSTVIRENSSEFWKYYFKLWIRFPKSMFGGYERITSINWASSSYGSVAYRGTISPQMEGFEEYEYRPIIKKGMHYTLDKLLFTYTDSSLSSIFWRPALAFILILLCMLTAIRKQGLGILFMALPILFNQLTYFIVIASQDTRYTYVNYTMFVIILALTLIKKKSIEKMPL